MSPPGYVPPTSRDLMESILRHLDVIVESLQELHRKTNSLLSGHNSLVEILRHQGRRMSKLGDSIREDDQEAVRLFDLVGQLINKINNGSSNLDPDAQQAFDALHAHFQAVAQEVESASVPADSSEPAAGGDTAAQGPDAGTVGV